MHRSQPAKPPTARARAARVVLVLGGAALPLPAPPSPAGAHAALESTDPIGGAVLDESPTAVSLTFSEAVVTSGDSIQLFDGDGQRLDLDRPEHPGGDGATVSAHLPNPL